MGRSPSWIIITPSCSITLLRSVLSGISGRASSSYQGVSTTALISSSDIECRISSFGDTCSPSKSSKRFLSIISSPMAFMYICMLSSCSSVTRFRGSCRLHEGQLFVGNFS
uniref:ORF66 n=1 Tax=Malaco herpesvirus 1 TaxID=3031797 RepID=A0AA48SFH5_9VIRU|nr:TPA_asm: ORF66 [Malaco herpesvirus 1]